MDIKVDASSLTLMDVKQAHPEWFYPQDWYEEELFANTPAARSIEATSYPVRWGSAVSYPAAVDAARLFVEYYIAGIVLWPNYYFWTSDYDSNNNRVYVGGYSLGHKKGFQIHRHIKRPNVRRINFTYV